VRNIIDACSIAATTALHHFRRPDISIGDGFVTIHSEAEKALVPLSIHHMPICVTFGIFEVGGEGILAVDPQWKEEKISRGRITMILNIHKELCGVQKSGGVALTTSQILTSAKIAMVKVKELTAVINEALKEDIALRLKQANDFLMVSGIGTDENEQILEAIKSYSNQSVTPTTTTTTTTTTITSITTTTTTSTATTTTAT